MSQLPRNRQAFEALLAPDDDSDDGAGAGGRGRKGQRRASKGPKRGGGGGAKVPGFKLREEAAVDAELGRISELFAGTLPADMIKQVFHACGASPEATVEALLSMASEDTGPGRPQTASSAAAVGPDSAATAGGGNAAASDAATDDGKGAAAAPCYWNWLPVECKDLVLGSLSLRDMARAAGACKEFAFRVRAQRAELRCAQIPQGVSCAAMRGLVAAFSCATAVDLSRWGRRVRFEDEFEPAFRAIAAGAADRLSGVPVDSVSLAKCPAVGDATVAALCSALRMLRCVDLTHCRAVSNPGLLILTEYRRAALEDEEELEEQRQLLAALALSQPSTAAGASSSLSSAAGTAAAAGGSARFTLEAPAQAVQRVAAAHAEGQRQRRAAAKQNHCDGLLELRLAGTAASTQSLAALLRGGARHTPSIRVLDVSRCGGVEDGLFDLLAAPQATLRTLRAAGCPRLRCIAPRSECATLQELSIPDCTQLRALRLDAPALEELNVSGCSALSTLFLRCPRLRRLRAAGCTSLTLHPHPLHPHPSTQLHCPDLEQLSLFGCRQVSDEGVEALLSGALSMLCSVDLTGCASLTRVAPPGGAGALALNKLVLDGCTALRRVAVQAPALEEVSARGCGSLQDLRLYDARPRLAVLENCFELHVVELGGGGSGVKASGGGGKRELVIRGCPALAPMARQRLQEAVLGAGK